MNNDLLSETKCDVSPLFNLAGFPDTEAWLKRNKYADGADRNAKAITLINAYMEFMDWDSEKEYPETMAMDKDRMMAISGRALRVCISASVLAIASSFPIIGEQTANRKSLREQIDVLLQNVNNNK